MTSSDTESPLLYEHADDVDHLEGGACIRVFQDEDPIARLERYSDEYATALATLFVTSDGQPSGWQSAAPAVFLAHHSCELALKVRWLRFDGSVTVSHASFRTHDLRDIARKVEEAGGWGELSDADQSQLDRAVERLREITKDGISIRYATISERWCCLNLGALVDLVFEVRKIVLGEEILRDEDLSV